MLRALIVGEFQMYRLSGFYVVVSILFGSSFSPGLAEDSTLTVFAAASMKNALDDIDVAYTAKTGVRFVVMSPWLDESRK